MDSVVIVNGTTDATLPALITHAYTRYYTLAGIDIQNKLKPVFNPVSCY